MAQVEGVRHIEKLTADHLLHSDDEVHGNLAPPSRSYDYEDDKEHHHEKKSVLTKVKEKAKKWKHVLQKKKHGHVGTGGNTISTQGAKLDEEMDLEFHGAPMYDSKMALTVYEDVAPTDFGPHKEKAGNQSTINHGISIKHMLEDKCKASHEDLTRYNNNNKYLTETVSDILTPAYMMVSKATSMITSKMQAPVLSARDEVTVKQIWDKGVYVKEYLLQKLEPGEDDKALSHVISEAISPRMKSSTVNVNIVDKMKGVTSMLFRMEGSNVSPIPMSTMPQASSVEASTQSTNLPLKYSFSVSKRTNHKPTMEYSKSMPTSARLFSYPDHLSVVAHRAVIPPTSRADEIEETGEKTLQEYLN